MRLDAADSIYGLMAQTRSMPEVRSCIERFAGIVDHTYYICEFLPADKTLLRSFALHNYPEIWLQRASLFPDAWYQRDPVFAHILVNPVPLEWTRGTYEQAQVCEVWEESSALGIGAGFAVAVSCAHGITLRIGISRDQAHCSAPGESAAVKAHLLLFATCLKARLVDVLIPELRRELPKLSGREIDALKWTRAGKTAWELGHILGISRGTANFHLENAKRKLASTDKHQAVLRAIDLQLID
jgi:DNA-binding CsgD family transcriptional regulator